MDVLLLNQSRVTVAFFVCKKNELISVVLRLKTLTETFLGQTNVLKLSGPHKCKLTL